MLALELALHALCWIAVLAIGSVHPTTQVLLAIAASALFLFAALVPLSPRGVRVPPYAWVLVVAMVWTACQLVPMPVGLLRFVSPMAATLRVDTGARFAPITLDTAATVLELVKLLLALCVVLVGTEAFRKGGARRAAISLSLLGGVCAALTWGHRFLAATQIYGLYTLHAIPGSGFFAPFVSGNNAASLFALCGLAAVGLAVLHEDWRRVLFASLAGVCGASLLGTLSRGGAVGLVVGALVFLTAVMSVKFGWIRAVLLSLAIVAASAGGASFVAQGMRGRFKETAREKSFAENQKVRGWMTALHLANDFPLTGVGRGAFEAPAAMLRPDDEGVRLVYPENVVMQVVSEWGYPFGLGLFVCLIVGLFYNLRRARIEPITAALLGGVLAVGVHDLFDFGLEFPGVSVPVCIAVAALVAGAEGNDKRRRIPRPRLRGMRLVPVTCIGVCICIAGLISMSHTLAADLEALSPLAARGEGIDRIDAAIARHPASSELEVLAGEAALRKHAPSALHHLGRAMRLQPSASRPHLLAAIELERLHLYGQAALEYRLSRLPIDDAELIARLGRHAIDAVERTARSYVALGQAFARQKRWDDAASSFQRAVELDADSSIRAAWLEAMPAERRPPLLENMEHEGHDPAELVRVINGWSELGQDDRAERSLDAAVLRFPISADIVAAGARLRLKRGDVDGARRLVGHTLRFDPQGRLVAEQVLLEIAQKTGDLDAAAAAQARLRLLRAKVDFEQPSRRGTP